MNACKKCGYELHVIKGLCYDRDGIREARFCPHCLTVFSTHAHGFEEKYVLGKALAEKQATP